MNFLEKMPAKNNVEGCLIQEYFLANFIRIQRCQLLDIGEELQTNFLFQLILLKLPVILRLLSDIDNIQIPEIWFQQRSLGIFQHISL